MKLKKTFVFLIFCLTFFSCSNNGQNGKSEFESDGMDSEQNDATNDEIKTDCEAGELSEANYPLFKNVTATAGLGIETAGFGRAAVVDINGDCFDDIVATPAHDGKHPTPPGDYDKLVLALTADKTFKNITTETGLSAVQTGLILFGDIDNDGDQDLYAGIIAGTSPQSGEGIYLNNGKGVYRFIENNGTIVLSQPCGSYICTASQITGTFADFNKDGFLDLYLGSWLWSDGVTETRYLPPGRDLLFQGRGDGTFEDISYEIAKQKHPLSNMPADSGRAAMGIAAGDYDNDGDVDIFVANYGSGRPWGPYEEPLCSPPLYIDQNIFWKNNGNMNFDEVGEILGVASTMRGPDGILEEEPLVIGEECPEEVRGNYKSPIGGNHFTPQWGDFDNDGDLDLLVGSIAHPDYKQSDPTLLLVNQGAPDFTFTEEAFERGLKYREDEKHAFFADIDNDGLLDIVTTGFRNNQENELRIYLQDQNHTFSLLSVEQTGISDHHQESIVFIDYDHDGDLDIYIAKDAEPAILYENTIGDSRHRITFKLEGKNPKDATGARITVVTGNISQIREVPGPSGHYNPQLSRTVYFGLGGKSCAEKVTVRWPDGTSEEIGTLLGDGFYIIKQGSGAELIKRFSQTPSKIFPTAVPLGI